MERYETISKLATGSSAIVYLARDKQVDGALVAIKVYQQAHIMPQVLKSATRETTLLRHCEGHPNVVQLHLAFRSERGRVYLVEEYIPRSLESLLSQGEALPWDVVWDLTHQLFTAIKFLHKKKVIHRDLKPRNLMLTDDGVLKVIDFGLARQDRPEDGRLTQYVLSRWYRAPEVLVGAAYGCEVDIWAAGCIVAELATRRPLFPGKNQMDQLQQLLHCFGTLPPRLMDVCGALISNDILVLPKPEHCVDLAGRLSDVPQEILQVIEACLQPDPLKRPTAAAVLDMPGLVAVSLADGLAAVAEQLQAAGGGSASRCSSGSLGTAEGHSCGLPLVPEHEQLELEAVGSHPFGSELLSEAPLTAARSIALDDDSLRHMSSLPDSLGSSPALSDRSTAADGAGPTLSPRAPDAAPPRSGSGRLMSAVLRRRAPTASRSFSNGSRQPARPSSEFSVAASDRSFDAASLSRLRTLDMLESKLFGMGTPAPAPADGPPAKPSSARRAAGKALTASVPQSGRYSRRSVEIPHAAAMYDQREREHGDRAPSSSDREQALEQAPSSTASTPQAGRYSRRSVEIPHAAAMYDQREREHGDRAPSSSDREQALEQASSPAVTPRRSVTNRFGWAETKLGAKSGLGVNFSRSSIERVELRAPGAPGPAPLATSPSGSRPVSAAAGAAAATAAFRGEEGRRASTFSRSSVELRLDLRAPGPSGPPSSSAPATPAVAVAAAATAFRIDDGWRASAAASGAGSPMRPSDGHSVSSNLPGLDAEAHTGRGSLYKSSPLDALAARPSPPCAIPGSGAYPDGGLTSDGTFSKRSTMDGLLSPKAVEDKLFGRAHPALRMTSMGSDDALASKGLESPPPCLRERTVSFGAARANTLMLQAAGSSGDFSWIKIGGESEDGGGSQESDAGQQVTAWRGRSLPRRGLSAFSGASGAELGSTRRQPGADQVTSPSSSSKAPSLRRPSLKESMRRSASREHRASDAM